MLCSKCTGTDLSVWPVCRNQLVAREGGNVHRHSMAELVDHRWSSRGGDASLAPSTAGSELSHSQHSHSGTVRFEVDVVDEEGEGEAEPEREEEGAAFNDSSVTMGNHTFGYRTLDAAPNTDHYSDTHEKEGERRPTLMDLLAGGRDLPKDTSTMVSGGRATGSEGSEGRLHYPNRQNGTKCGVPGVLSAILCCVLRVG